MNPYLGRLMELEEKMGPCSNNSTDILEFMKTAGEIRRWDEERKRAIKKSNNDSISEISIKIDDELVMLLCPRVKLIYNRNSGPIINPLNLAFTLRRLFVLPCYSEKPVFIDLDDVRSNDCSKTIAVFVRDFSFLPPPDNSLPINSKISLARQFLRSQNLTNLSVFYNYCPHPLVYELVDDDDHHPNNLIHQFQLSYPGYMDHRRPMILVQGLVSAFPSNKSTHFSNFFSSFGSLRYFDIQLQLDTVSIEYQRHCDFLDALNTLCCCSIRKDGSHKLFEFEVELKCPQEKEKELGILELVEAVRL